jgi:hypothetical protein
VGATLTRALPISSVKKIRNPLLDWASIEAIGKGLPMALPDS